MRLFLGPVDRIGLEKQAKLEFRGRLGILHQKLIDLRRSRVVNPGAARQLTVVQPIVAPVRNGRATRAIGATGPRRFCARREWPRPAGRAGASEL